MATKQLYSLVIPSDSQTSRGGTMRRNLNSQGVMSSDVPAVTSVSPQPGERSVQGQYRGKFSVLSATEMEELFNASGFESVPYFAQDRQNASREDGYYALTDITVEPIDPRGDSVFRFDGTLTHEGSRRSHWRAIKTTPTEVDSLWAGNPGADFAISHLAQKVRWVDESAGTVENADPVRSRETEKGTVDIYDAEEATGDAPTLIFDLPYEAEYRTDCRVWDDHHRPKELVEPAPGTGSKVGSATVGSATVGPGERVVVESQWQRVFRTLHEFHGNPVVESGALRLIPDETNRILRAFVWDSTDYIWDVVQLGSSPWRLYDFDIEEIRPELISAHVTFEKEKSGLGYGENYGNNYGGTTGIGEQFALKMELQRGLVRARFLRPKNEDDPVPADLKARVAPIGRIQKRSAAEKQTLVPRSEVQ